MKKVNYFAATVLAFTLVGCGGGGGAASATLTPFVSWSAIQPSSRVQVSTISEEGAYTYDLEANEITSISVAGRSAQGSVIGTFDDQTLVEAVTLDTGTGKRYVWSNDNSPVFETLRDGYLNRATSADGERTLILGEPARFGLEYQTFGVWSTGIFTGQGDIGTLSMGAATPVSQIPVSGSATYEGPAFGQATIAGRYDYVTSVFTATADFVNRTVQFNTQDTALANNTDLRFVAGVPNLNLNGTLRYVAANNLITGQVTATNGWSGSAAARFYGPNAREIGGTFHVLGTGGREGYIGAFGGKQ
jgi:hypothetical protein